MGKPSAQEGLSPYLQLKELKSFRSPSLANHWCDLHMLLDAVPGFPSGIVNPLPLLHGQRELLRSFICGHSYVTEHLRLSQKFPHTVITVHTTLLYCCTHCDVDMVTMHKDKTTTRSTCPPLGCLSWVPGHLINGWNSHTQPSGSLGTIFETLLSKSSQHTHTHTNLHNNLGARFVIHNLQIGKLRLRDSTNLPT
jgi:hypothetical protein